MTRDHFGKTLLVWCVLVFFAAQSSGCPELDDPEDDDPGGDSDVDADGDADGDADTDSHTPSLDDPCPMEKKIGVFEIAHRELYSAITGQVANGVIPLSVLQEAESEGSCQLMRRVNPFCDPPCTNGEICDHDDQCIPFPTNKSVGEVTIEGLKSRVAMEPNSVNSYQDTTVSSPPFEPGSPIMLVANGAELESFILDGFGVAPIEMDDTKWVMKDGDAMEISWIPAEGPGRILATFNVDQHGNSPVTMFCDFEDTGSGTIPAGLVSELIEYGLSGYANGHLYRRTVDSVEIEQGCVELVVFSHLQAELTVDGFTPEW